MQRQTAAPLHNLIRHSRLFSTTVVHASHVGSKPVPLTPAVTLSLLQPSLPRTRETPSAQGDYNYQGSQVGGLRHNTHASDTAASSSSLTALYISGPKGTQTLAIPEGIQVEITDASSSGAPSSVTLRCTAPESRKARSDWGLTRALLANAVEGVTTGFAVKVRLVGVGYRASVEEMSEPALPSGSGTATPRSDAQQSTEEKLPIGQQQQQQQQLVMRLGYPRPVRIPIPQGLVCTVLAPTEIEIQGQDKQLLGRFAADIRRWRLPEPYNGKGIFVGSETVRRKEVKKK